MAQTLPAPGSSQTAQNQACDNADDNADGHQFRQYDQQNGHDLSAGKITHDSPYSFPAKAGADDAQARTDVAIVEPDQNTAFPAKESTVERRSPLVPRHNNPNPPDWSPLARYQPLALKEAVERQRAAGDRDPDRPGDLVNFSADRPTPFRFTAGR